MARNYSTKAFFRHAPNPLLARYFKEHKCLLDFNFTLLKENKPDNLFEAWLTLDTSIKQELDTDFQDIFNLSCEKGIKAIIDEATHHAPDNLSQFNEELAAKKNFYDMAFSTLLNYPTYWKGAVLFFHADSLGNWRKRKNIPKVTPSCADIHLQKLAALIASYFHLNEGKGKHCFVEALKRGPLDYFFAYPEDYSQRSHEWIKDEFAPRPHNPAFEIVYVYNQQKGSLDLYYKGNYKAVESLQVFFAKAILGVEELEPVKNDSRVYDLNPLLNADFNFVYAPNSGIEDIRISTLRLSSKIKKGDRITLEGDSKNNAQAVYQLLNNLSPALSLHNYYLTRVEMVASVLIAAGKPAKNIRFAITYPNSCSLKYEAEDLLLRAMLEQSGVEPKDDELAF